MKQMDSLISDKTKWGDIEDFAQSLIVKFVDSISGFNLCKSSNLVIMRLVTIGELMIIDKHPFRCYQ